MNDRNETSSPDTIILRGLQSEEYEHPFDKQALNALEGTPGLETLIRKFNQNGIEKIFKVQCTGSNIKVSSKNLPDLDNVIKTVCKTIHLRDVPELYIEQGDEINACTIGSENPIVIIKQGCIEKLSTDELLFIIGHEIGHIKSQHCLYHLLASVFPIIGDIVGAATLGIGSLISKPIEIALLNWQRKSEFTADRAGLLACQKIEAAITTMMKIAGTPVTHYNSLNPMHFLEQAREFQGFDDNSMNKLMKAISAMGSTHPWTVMRCAEMQKWIESGYYRKILLNHSQSVTTNTSSEKSAENENLILCIQCEKKIRRDSKFCIHCGSKR